MTVMVLRVAVWGESKVHGPTSLGMLIFQKLDTYERKMIVAALQGCPPVGAIPFLNKERVIEQLRRFGEGLPLARSALNKIMLW